MRSTKARPERIAHTPETTQKRLKNGHEPIKKLTINPKQNHAWLNPNTKMIMLNIINDKQPLENQMTPLSQYLKQLRKQMRWTQKNLADALKVEVSYIGMLEVGRIDPPETDELERYGKVLGLNRVQLDELIKLGGYSKRKLKLDPVQTTPEQFKVIHDMFNILSSLTTDDTKFLRTFVQVKRREYKLNDIAIPATIANYLGGQEDIPKLKPILKEKTLDLKMLQKRFQEAGEKKPPE